MTAFALGDRWIDTTLRTVHAPDGEHRLTEREARLLDALAAGQGRPVSSAALLAAAWDGDGTESALLTAVARLRRKLDADGPSPLRTARHEGYALAVTAEKAPLPGVAPAALLGRDEEIETLSREARRGRVVTLLGPAGAGKTTLARALVRMRAEAGAAVAICEIGTGFTLGDIVRATAAATGAPIDGRDVADDVRGLATWLGRYGLLVLDNGEEALGALATAVERWSPHVALVVTSRSPLGVQDEQRVAVGPLPAEAARALFVRTAEAAAEGVVLDPRLVDRIVARLDHLPLAILLTAPHLRVFGPEALLERLDRPLAVLESARRDLPERHRAVRVALERSWELLHPADRDVLAGVSVFPGSFALDAAEAVLGAAGVLRGVHAGLDGSLLRVAGGGDGPRVAMFGVVREFAGERLVGERRAAAVAAHARWVVGEAEGEVLRLGTAEDGDALRRLSRLLPDLFAAADRADAALAVRAILAADAVLAVRGPSERQGELLDRAVALARSEVPDRLAAALLARGLFREQRSPGGPEDLAEAMELAARAGDAATLAQVRFARVNLNRRRGRYAPGSEAMQEAAAAVAEAPDARSEARARLQLGSALLDLHDVDGAERELTAAAEGLARVGDARSRGLALCRLGVVRRLAGNPAGAEEVYREALRIGEETGDSRLESIAVGSLGLLLLDYAGWGPALEMISRASERAGFAGDPRMIAMWSVHLARVLTESGDAAGALERLDAGAYDHDPQLRAQLGYTRARALYAAGRSDDALAILGGLDLTAERDHELYAFTAALRVILSLERGDLEGARAAAPTAATDPLGARAAELVRGLIAAHEGDGDHARAALAASLHDDQHDLRWLRGLLARALGA